MQAETNNMPAFKPFSPFGIDTRKLIRKEGTEIDCLSDWLDCQGRINNEEWLSRLRYIQFFSTDKDF